MNQKHTIAIFRRSQNAGFDVFCLPPLKDRYIENHIYQGRRYAVCIFEKSCTGYGFRRFCRRASAGGTCTDSKQAAVEYYLPPDKIGDFVLLAGEDIAFGEVGCESIHTEDSRTHGSLYEREILADRHQYTAEKENDSNTADVAGI